VEETGLVVAVRTLVALVRTVVEAGDEDVRTDGAIASLEQVRNIIRAAPPDARAAVLAVMKDEAVRYGEPLRTYLAWAFPEDFGRA